jgi:rubredoxin
MAKFRCPGCDYTYDETLGDKHEGYPPGTPFESLPEEFTCPDCAVRYKEDFQPLAD